MVSRQAAQVGNVSVVVTNKLCVSECGGQMQVHHAAAVDAGVLLTGIPRLRAVT